ncbi:MAG: hypothetical protein WC956_00910 [bacterium]
MTRRTLLILALALLISAHASSARAYLLPAYKITAEQRAVPAEETLAHYEQQLAQIRSQVSLTILADRHRDYKARVQPHKRAALASYDELQEPLAFWRWVVDLKKHLVALQGSEPPAKAVDEADDMAKMIVQRIYDISQEYRVAFTALFQNFMMNMGAHKRGYCYQYVEDLLKTLTQRQWRFYELRWGKAWADSWLENNALVITAKGAPFKSGLAVDSWRSAGKPFWTPVKGDSYPWKEIVEKNTAAE